MTQRSLLGPLFVIVLFCLVLPVRAAGEGPTSVLMPPLLDFDASLRPTDVPADHPVPAALTLAAKVVRGASIGPLPGISGLALQFDRDLTVGLNPPPDCGAMKGRRPGHCARVTIGRGTFLLFDDPDGSTTTKGRWKILSGIRGRRPSLELVVLAPVDETFRVPLPMRPVTGSSRFGSELRIVMPAIDGGRATLHSFTLTLGNGFTSLRTASPIIWAECPAGALRVAAEATATDGEKMQTEAVRRC